MSETLQAEGPVEVLVGELRRLTEVLERSARRAELPSEIVPNRLYTPEEAAHLLGMKSDRGPKSVGEMMDLPKVKVGGRGGLTRYLGKDMLKFIEGRREG